MNRYLLPVVTLVLAACAAKGRAPESAKAGPLASSEETGAAAEMTPAGPPWQRQSEAVELLCHPAPTETYAASLRAGRKQAAAKRWGEAVDEFHRALEQRPEDPVALGELSWALWSAGDAPQALATAQLASERSHDPKQKAAALYNAGRAAEGLGDLEQARSLLEASLALRDHETVKQQLAHLTAPTVRAAPAAEAWKGCKGLPSAAAVCSCLEGSSEERRCEATEGAGERGQVVSVLAPAAADSDLFVQQLVLIAKTGATWSALQLVEVANAVNPDEEALTNEEAKVSVYEELPYRGGTLHWVQTVSETTRMVEQDSMKQGHSWLTICWVRDKAAPTCSRFGLAEWDYAFNSGYLEAARCDIWKFVHYRVDAKSSGEVHLVLEAGVDEKALVGRYRLPPQGS